MAKRSQTVCRLLPTNCLSVLDHFWGLALKKKYIFFKQNYFAELCNVGKMCNHVIHETIALKNSKQTPKRNTSSVIRQKGESQNGGNKKIEHAEFSEKWLFLTP